MKKMNWELMLLENFNDPEHTILLILIEDTTSMARVFTKNFTRAAKKPLNISMIGIAPFNYLIQLSQKGSEIQIFCIILWDINIALAQKKNTNPATKFPIKYHNFLDVFLRSDVDVLPKYRPGYNQPSSSWKAKHPREIYCTLC